MKEPRCTGLCEAKASLRLKIWITSGSKKGTQIYYSFLSKCQQMNPLQVSKMAPIEREACLQGTLHIIQKPHLSGSPVKEPNLSPAMEPLERERDAPPPEPLHPALKVPGRWALLQVPQTEPLWQEMPVSRAFSKYPSGSLAREPSLQVPFTELPQRETLHLWSPFQPYLKVLGRWAHSRLPNLAFIKRDSHPQSFPFVTFRAPKKGAPPPCSPNRAPIERDAPFPQPPFNYPDPLKGAPAK
jgi:hypothetical protein